MIPWLHLITPLIGAKITAYAISCTIHEVTLFSLKGNYWNRLKIIVTQKGIVLVHDY